MLNGAKQSLIAIDHWHSEVVVNNAGSGIPFDQGQKFLVVR